MTKRKDKADDEKYIDPYAVCTNQLLKKYRDVDLMPTTEPMMVDIYRDGKKLSGPHHIVIDVKHYQRNATNESQSIVATLRQDGALPAVKTAVLRKNGDIAIVDGGQTWRACDVVKRPMSVRLFDFDSVELEAQLFYILNRVRTVTADIRVRAATTSGCADFLRELNEETDFHHWFWRTSGHSGKMSATRVLKAAVAMFSDTEAVGSDVSIAMQALDQPNALGSIDKPNKKNREILREYLTELNLTFFSQYVPRIEEYVALAMIKKARGLKPLTKPMQRALGSTSKSAKRDRELMMTYTNHARRIKMLTGVFEDRLDRLPQIKIKK